MAVFRPALPRHLRACVLSRHRCLRLTGLAALFITYLVATRRQWGRARLRLAIAVFLAAAEAAAFAAPRLLLLPVAAAAAALFLAAALDGDDGTGHRGGAEGFAGCHCENTIEATRALLQREEREGPLPNFPYLGAPLSWFLPCPCLRRPSSHSVIPGLRSSLFQHLSHTLHPRCLPVQSLMCKRRPMAG